MKSLVFVCVALLGVLCLVSCSDEGTPVNPSQGIEFEQVLSGSPPAQSGPFVIRYDAGMWVWFWDTERDLFAVVGLDVWDACTVGDAPDIVHFQDITERNEQEAVNEIFNGDNMSVSVWPVASLDCAVLLNTEPLGWGYIDLRGTDNDVYAWLHEDPKRINSYGMTGHGVLETPDGGTANLTINFRAVWRADIGIVNYHEKMTLATTGGKNIWTAQD